MLRKFVFWLLLIALAAACAISFSCGSSSPTKCTGGPYNVVGNWQGTFTAGSTSLAAYGAIDASGLALFFDATPPGEIGDTLLLPAITGACSFSGKVTAYAEPGSVPLGNPIAITDTSQGNVTSTSAISGTFSGPTSGNYSLASFSPLSGSAAALTGALSGEVEGSINGQGVLFNLTFSAPMPGSASMSFSGIQTGSSCSLSGTFTQVGTSNVFDVSVTFPASGCPVSGAITGLGFESNTDYFDLNGTAAGTYLYADLLASSGPFVIEIFTPGASRA
jgi:hypothetical protein